MEKISFHFIHANPCVLFDNNVTLGLFIKVLIHFLLYSIAEHKCSNFNINLNVQKISTTELLILITPYINTLRLQCNNCFLYSNYVSVANISDLLVFNKKNQLTFAIDTDVYSKNQQFRLFDCVKKEQLNPLVQSASFPFSKNIKLSYIDLLKKSIVTNIDELNMPIISLKNNEFLCNYENQTNLYEINHNNRITLTHLNRHFSSYYLVNTKYITNTYQNNSNIQQPAKNTLHNNKQEIEQFTPFVKRLIDHDKSHQGYIRSCVRGTYDTDILFFNIGGEYRYCEKRGAHHKRNTTTILLDTKNETYSIRYKDPDCDNKVLISKKIE
ncbi:unnamed protein product [Rotaria sp. Silwood2]|nr:unnamed protein product [Rotaria sp. Silwood2]CAF4648083.1 unnamed protein product [Rotaria sp. Silwood2]